MRIYTMTATFGKLEHASLSLKPGLNVIHAPNEWGKSTWCAFLSAMLYGIETRVHTTKTALADKDRYQPWSGQPMSGRIDLCWNGRDITIERESKGRSSFGKFRAYETASGLEVSELTADNCGQQLLGVEKSVFLRSAFLRLNDLPVTDDEALRRRLNSLVTTGDERNTADFLGQKLRDLKNRCRANRSTGLLPQMEQQQSQLENKLSQLQQLQSQWEDLRQQQLAAQAQRQQLENHRQAMAYQASRLVSDRLISARNALGQARLRCLQLEEECRQDPTPETLHQRLDQLLQLQQHRESLQFDGQMLPAAPEAPQPPTAFEGLAREDLSDQVVKDQRQYQLAVRQRKNPTWAIIGAILLLFGIAGFLVTDGLFQWVSLAVSLVGVLCFIVFWILSRKAANRQRRFLQKYAPMPPKEWESAAAKYAALLDDYHQQLQNYQILQDQLKLRAQQLEDRILDATDGRPLEVCILQLQQAQSRQQALLDASRAFHQAKELVQTLEQAHRQALPPESEDTLDLSEEDTLQQLSSCNAALQRLQARLGHTQGLAEALGTEAELTHQLHALQERKKRLEDVYAALEIAQDTLQQATLQLQQRFAPRISRRAKEIFAELTEGRYDRLTLTQDLTVEVAAAGEDTLHNALWRSEGTADQLYFSLRLAVAEALIPQVPLILDDTLARFDEQRLTQAMKLLQKISQSRQVILFTCQKRETEVLALLQTASDAHK